MKTVRGIGSRKQLISMNISLDILDKIDKFNQEEITRFPNRTSCIEYLTNTALYIINKVKHTPPTQFRNEMEEVYQQLKNGGLVDYLENISDTDLKLLYDLINDEYELRDRKRSKLLHVKKGVKQ